MTGILKFVAGDEEKKYWEKVIADRNRKYDKNQSHDIKKKKQRGKDKVIMLYNVKQCGKGNLVIR